MLYAAGGQFLGFGQLGYGDEQQQLLPKKVEALAGQRVLAVSAGVIHSLALTADGAVWSWGWGGLGQLGHGNRQDQLLPKKIEAFAGHSASSLCRLEMTTASPSPPTAPSESSEASPWAGLGIDGCHGCVSRVREVKRRSPTVSWLRRA